jgi:hypothetical protein
VPNCTPFFSGLWTQGNPDAATLQHPDTWGTQDLRTAGSLIAANTTAPQGIRVISLKNESDAAVFVPSQVSSGYAFRAGTYGVKATCSSLNQRCQMSENQAVETCGNIGYPMIPTDTNAPFGGSPKSYILGQLGDDTIGKNVSERGYGLISPNPAKTVLQLRWSSGMNSLAQQPNPAVSVVPVPEIAIYASCDLEYFNGTLRYNQGAYSLLNKAPSTPEFTTMMWSPLIWVSCALTVQVYPELDV